MPNGTDFLFWIVPFLSYARHSALGTLKFVLQFDNLIVQQLAINRQPEQPHISSEQVILLICAHHVEMPLVPCVVCFLVCDEMPKANWYICLGSWMQATLQSFQFYESQCCRLSIPSVRKIYYALIMRDSINDCSIVFDTYNLMSGT